MLRFKADPRTSLGSGSARVSGAGKCPRSISYNYRRYPKKPHPDIHYVKQAVTFAQGTAIHDEFRKHLSNVLDMEREVWVPLDSGARIKGHIDGLIADPDTGELRLLEIKTMQPFIWRSVAGGGEIEPSYLIQAHLYLWALQQEGEPIQEILFVAIDKASGQWCERILPFDPEIAERGRENLLIGIQVPPESIERPYAPDAAGHLPWQCVYCDFWATCWPNAAPLLVDGKPGLRVDLDYNSEYTNSRGD